MKSIYFILLALVAASSPASAAEWPARIVDLPQDSLALVAQENRGISLDAFQLSGMRETVGEHAIVFYDAVGPVITCTAGWRAGLEDQDRYYIDLYVEGSRVKQVVSFANYACPQD